MSRDRDLMKQEVGAGLARRLRSKRLEAGLTTDALAQAAGVGRAQVIRAEAGEGGGCQLATIALIALALDVPAGWLAFGAGEPK